MVWIFFLGFSYNEQSITNCSEHATDKRRFFLELEFRKIANSFPPISLACFPDTGRFTRMDRALTIEKCPSCGAGYALLAVSSQPQKCLDLNLGMCLKTDRACVSQTYNLARDPQQARGKLWRKQKCIFHSVR